MSEPVRCRCGKSMTYVWVMALRDYTFECTGCQRPSNLCRCALVGRLGRLSFAALMIALAWLIFGTDFLL